MNITNKTSTNWLRRALGLTLGLALAACSAGIDDSNSYEPGSVSSALEKQAEGGDLDPKAEAEAEAKAKALTSKDPGGDGEISQDPAESSLKARGGGLNFDCTEECGGGGGCCTCYGIWDCIRMGGSGQCKPGTFGCGGDGCMCDWDVFH